jgi:hypothetical protein
MKKDSPPGRSGQKGERREGMEDEEKEKREIPEGDPNASGGE